MSTVTLQSCHSQVTRPPPPPGNASSLALASGAGSTELSVSERTSVFLEKVDCHLLAGEADMAAQAMDEAKTALHVRTRVSEDKCV